VDDRTNNLLTEIRDSQNELLKVQQQMLANQEKAIAQQSLAVENQFRNSRLVRVVFAIIAVVVVYAFWLLYSLKP
jgi:hypothetical protein